MSETMSPSISGIPSASNSPGCITSSPQRLSTRRSSNGMSGYSSSATRRTASRNRPSLCLITLALCTQVTRRRPPPPPPPPPQELAVVVLDRVGRVPAGAPPPPLLAHVLERSPGDPLAG